MTDINIQWQTHWKKNKNKCNVQCMNPCRQQNTTSKQYKHWKVISLRFGCFFPLLSIFAPIPSPCIIQQQIFRMLTPAVSPMCRHREINAAGRSKYFPIWTSQSVYNKSIASITVLHKNDVLVRLI